MIDTFNKQQETSKTKAEEHTQAKVDTEENLKKEWGADYDANMEHMWRAMRKFGGEEFKKFMVETKMGNNVEVIKTFVNIGKSIAEGTMIEGEPDTTKVKTKDEELMDKYKSMQEHFPEYRQAMVQKPDEDDELKKRYPSMAEHLE